MRKNEKLLIIMIFGLFVGCSSAEIKSTNRKPGNADQDNAQLIQDGPETYILTCMNANNVNGLGYVLHCNPNADAWSCALNVSTAIGNPRIDKWYNNVVTIPFNSSSGVISLKNFPLTELSNKNAVDIDLTLSNLELENGTVKAPFGGTLTSYTNGLSMPYKCFIAHKPASGL